MREEEEGEVVGVVEVVMVVEVVGVVGRKVAVLRIS